MYSNLNNDKYQPSKPSIVESLIIKDIVLNMIKTGEYNRQYMEEVILASYPTLGRKKASTLVLKAMLQAQCN